MRVVGRWRGPFCPEDSKSWTPALQAAVGYDTKKALAAEDNGVCASHLTHSMAQYWQPTIQLLDNGLWLLLYSQLLLWPDRKDVGQIE